MLDKPILFEVFTKVEDENKALFEVENFGVEVPQEAILKKYITKAIGEKGTNFLRQITNLSNHTK